MLEEVLVGFDVRLQKHDENILWPVERRMQFLLAPDVSQPLSVDVMVWPSGFSDSRNSFCEEPKWTGPLTPIWESLDELLEFWNFNCASTSSCVCAIALSLVISETPQRQLAEFVARDGDLRPRRLDPAWKFLGYDIADKGLLSGLMNCGYAEGREITALRSEWAHLINEHHLFVARDDALSFQKLTDDRVPEHAPFSVFGIWLIKCSSEGRL